MSKIVVKVMHAKWIIKNWRRSKLTYQPTSPYYLPTPSGHFTDFQSIVKL